MTELRINGDYGWSYYVSRNQDDDIGGYVCEFTEAEAARILAAKAEWDAIEEMIGKRYEAEAAKVPTSEPVPPPPYAMEVPITCEMITNEAVWPPDMQTPTGRMDHLP